MNLVINANDAMPEGGQVRIATANSEFSAEEAPSRDGKGGWVVLSVTDTGTGIDEAVLPHIFEPFYTTKERERGTGLGLSTVYGIVTHSGGKVTVEPGAAGGTSFRVYLPRADRRPVAPASRSAGVLPPRPGASVVLVAEDDPGIRNLVSRVLTGAGHEVLTAADGVHATEVLEALDRPPDLLVTDLVMPRMGGGELARRMRASSPGVPVLFMSGYADTATLGGGLGPDDDVLLKPFDPAGLVARVHTALAEAGTGSRGSDPSSPTDPL
jgi:CheY-like chemotaxis protein